MNTSPWPISPDQFTKVLKQLRFRYFKWDSFAAGKCLLLPESIILSRAEHEFFIRQSEGFSALLGRVEKKLHRNREWLRQLAIPEPLFPLIENEPDQGLQITRYDWFPTTEGRWLVSEFNEDVPGGFNEAAGIPGLLQGMLSGGQFVGDLRSAILAAFQGAESIGLMFATGYSEDLQHMLLLEKWFQESGKTSVLCSPAQLESRRGRWMVSGTEIDAVFRFYPGEWIPLLPNARLWRRQGAQLKMMNPLRRLIRQSKLLFSLWHEPGLLDGPDLDLVQAHAPWSEPFDPVKISQYIAGRETRVLKKAFGRMGDSVVMGNLATPQHWSNALSHAAKSPGEFTVQERFVVEPIDFAAGNLFPAIGVYLVNGRFAGYYSRAASKPFLTHEAYHVATLIADS